jgi:hypothetical protein
MLKVMKKNPTRIWKASDICQELSENYMGKVYNSHTGHKLTEFPAKQVASTLQPSVGCDIGSGYILMKEGGSYWLEKNE